MRTRAKTRKRTFLAAVALLWVILPACQKTGTPQTTPTTQPVTEPSLNVPLNPETPREIPTPVGPTQPK